MIRTSITQALIPPEAIPRMTQEVLTHIVSNVAASARSQWIKLAKQDSSVFRFDYMQGIQPVSAQGTRHTVTLVGEIPHLLEDGDPRRDLRDTLLGPNVPVVPVGKRGKHLSRQRQFYRAIPFRHTTPGSGQAIGQAMGSAYAGHSAVENAKTLGTAVYQAAKGLEATTTTPYGKTRWGGRLSTSRLRSGLKAGQAGVPLLKEHHKSSIYEGMIRSQKFYRSALQSQYVTFRTISTGVRDASWWRKAIRARHYAEAVQRFVDKLLPQAIEHFLEPK